MPIPWPEFGYSKELHIMGKILKHEIITDQSDPRMLNFRKALGEFEPGAPRKTIKLEITKYKPDPQGFKITTDIGYYEGEPPPGYREFWSKIYNDTLADLVKQNKIGVKLAYTAVI